MTVASPWEDERDFLGPRRPTWTDFERLWYLRDLAESSQKRLENLDRDPESKTEEILSEDAFLKSSQKVLEKISDRISFF